MTDEDYLGRAILKAQEGIDAGQSPFGAVIVRGGAIVAEAHNTVLRDVDPTAHAEVNGIRAAASALGSIDLHGGTLYSTCEPCPMCMAAIHWAKLDRVVFGASIADATSAGFSKLPIPASRIVELGRSPVRVDGGLLREECAALFRRWIEAGGSQTY
jgi:tRNA(Arg) A34 adenosine deaminase TadA